MPAPVAYDPSVENVPHDEAETFDGLIATLLGISEITFADNRHALRSVHAKSHGIIDAELEIAENLPAHLAQGLFATAGRYPVVMRFSTIPGDLLEDAVSIPRAVAIKVIGVPGVRLAGSENDATQDFLMADSPAFAAPNAKKFLSNLKLLAATTDKAPELKKALSTVLRGIEAGIESTGAHSGLLRTLGGHPADHILGAKFYAQAPIRYGDDIAKMGLMPVSGELLRLKDERLDLRDRPDALRDAVREHFRTHGAVWDLCAQLCTDLKAMPVEDASVPWPEDQSPYLPVARITAQPQDAWSPSNITRVDEGMSFNPWHGLAAHRPLGSVMRARKAAYPRSVAFRQERNGCPIVEPGRQRA